MNRLNMLTTCDKPGTQHTRETTFTTLVAFFLS